MIEQSLPFLEKVFSRINEQNIDLKSWTIDHICYRTSSIKNYEESKVYFSTIGELLIESDINGRPIASFKLYSPINFRHYSIPVVEVPAPKRGKETPEGFEHIEFVIDEDFDQIIKQYPQCNFDTKGLSKELNPELEIEFKDCAIKLHHQSLEQVIDIEKSQNL